MTFVEDTVTPEDVKAIAKEESIAERRSKASS
jgi:hypothetical protein